MDDRQDDILKVIKEHVHVVKLEGNLLDGTIRLPSDFISRQAAIDALTRFITPHDNGDGTMTVGVLSKSSITDILNDLPSAQPDFSCEGCQTPKHICGICMRNYPNITDHYTGGEAG